MHDPSNLLDRIDTQVGRHALRHPSATHLLEARRRHRTIQAFLGRARREEKDDAKRAR